MARSEAGGAQVLVDRTVQRIERMIVDGTLGSGAKLSEVALSQQLGVSRGPLREAIRTLEGRRIVERMPHSGARVRVLTIDDIEQILITREALEAMACRQAAENMSAREIGELRRCLDSLNAARPALGKMPDVGLIRLGVQEEDFHVQLARGSRNRWLAEILCRDLYALLCIVRFKAASVGGRIETAQAEHYEIVQMIEKRDPDGAERLMRNHISAGRRSLMAQLRDDPTFMSQVERPAPTPFLTFGAESRR
jgi:DNA-binding GntR family transcriptional regulator